MLKCVKRYLNVNRSKTDWGVVQTLPQVLEQISSKKMVIFGEVHSNKHVIELQNEIQKQMMKDTEGKLNIVFEHFNFEMQELLEAYQS